MREDDQRALTATVIHELAIDPFTLWLHYLSIGGNLDYQPVLAYVEGRGPLPVKERDMVSVAVNDFALEPLWRPRAPYSDSETA
ncbi:hypothetical protein JOE31_001263 [Arthrobacter sp. PvP023]|uniref:hypothetical protein n=1 Tax=Micrococcaceae TaxID=1268 RepID=UPI001AE76140|nr:hypothetical protein [Arthrobacter sp. PvP023]MBP1135031.1 hypothetical protein [Arthrobacter sp. PvP023]